MSILIFIPELHRDLIVGESEELFAKHVIMLLVPFPLQEINYCLSPGKEPLSVAPDAVFSVRFGDKFWISGEICQVKYKGNNQSDSLPCVPGILSLLHFLLGCFKSEWWCERHVRKSSVSTTGNATTE